MDKLTTMQAAEYLGCSSSKLEKDRTKGSTLPYIKVGRNVYYTLQALDKYLSDMTFTSTAQYGGKQ